MFWYWKVRIYNTDGNYAHGQIKTDEQLSSIDTIQDFYFTLTGGCKMLLEGMAREPFAINDIDIAFHILWKDLQNEKA